MRIGEKEKANTMAGRNMELVGVAENPGLCLK